MLINAMFVSILCFNKINKVRFSPPSYSLVNSSIQLLIKARYKNGLMCLVRAKSVFD